MNYLEKLSASIRGSRSVLCVGLDPVPEHFPPEIRALNESESNKAVSFCRRVIEQTKTAASAYKINLAYFEVLGQDAFHVLNEVLDAIPSGKIIIADAKRCDVPHSNIRYKVAYFDRMGFDAITLAPFMGMETLEPFLQDTDRAVYAVTLTSNPGAADFLTQPFAGAPSLSTHIASLLRQTAGKHPGHFGSLGMVIGATQSEQYGPVMKAYPEAPLLIPGIGAQGGSITRLQKHLDDHIGFPLINASRGISGFDPESNDPWEIQVAHNTDHFKNSLRDITSRYLNTSNS